MKRAILYFLLLFSISNLAYGRTTPRGSQRTSNAAAAGSYDASALSMVIWGTGLAVVITTAAILIPNSTSGDSNGGNGSNGHAHSN